MTVRSGQAVAHVSRSAQQADSKRKTTSVISGRNFGASSPSAVLQSSLESRLRVALDVTGSPEYVLTWKHWTMQSGPPICALRASARRISDNGCTGWPTPNARPKGRGGLQRNPVKALERRIKGHMLNLDDAVTLVGWPTPIANDYLGSTHCYSGKNPDGSPKIYWKLPGAAMLVRKENHLTSVISGQALNRLLVSTEKRGVLDPAFSRWLMGYPLAWDAFTPMEMPSYRKSLRRLSDRSLKPRRQTRATED